MTDPYKIIANETPAYMTRYWLTNLANVSALLFANLPEVNWAGFYLVRNGQLELGPFQGRPACLTIRFDRGVCGAAARERRTQIVADVHAFPGHIACDAASESEIVIPLLKGDRLLGVLDVDSPKLSRFNEADARELQRLVDMLIAATDWPADFE